jgi:lysophospholipase L1-like esterase
MIIMLGTNDTKERFGANAAAIAVGMERLILKCKSIPAWRGGKPNILVVCPPALGAGFHDEAMGPGCVEKSVALPPYMEAVAKRNGVHYLNAADCEFNSVDFTHLSRRGHAQLAEKLAALVPPLL